MENPFRRFYFQIIVVLFALGVVFQIPNSERVGDRLQAAIPLVGLVCSFELKEAADYSARYFLGLAAVHATKNTLPDRGIDARPNGHGNGFPSGHTYSASYGASYIARKCAQRVPYLGVVAVIGAAFTGATRVEAQKHTSFQVLIGMIYAVLFDLGLRGKESRGLFKKRLSFLLRRIKSLFS